MRFESCSLAVVITLKSVVFERSPHFPFLNFKKLYACLGFVVFFFFFGVSVCLWADVATQIHRYRHDFSRRERKRGSVVPVEKKKNYYLNTKEKKNVSGKEKKKRGNKRHVVLV